jgi:membrane-associated protease RseP (regulator of RpoE activity)
MSDPSQPISYTFEVPSRPEVFVVAQGAKRPYWLHLLLLLLTMVTTLVVGAQLYDNFRHGLPAFTLGSETMPLFHPKWIWQQPGRLLMGIPFSASLMAILLAHELGHFLYCEKYGVNATLPFFIPAPTLIGTMGAFIRIKSRIHSRKELFDIGVAGPIAGFVVALPLLVLGLLLSKPMVPTMGRESIDVGFPLVFQIAHWILRQASGSSVPLSRLALHPVAVAAWVGMFATALNLLPGGQLDGGHIIYSIAPRAHRWITRVTVGVLALLSSVWMGWLVWAAILGLTGWRHPAVPVWPELGATRRRLAFVPVILLVLTFVPAPILGQGWLSR